MPNSKQNEDGKLRKRRTSNQVEDDETGTSWKEMEKNFIYEALRKNNWNRTATAAQMGVHPTTLWRRMKRLNMVIPSKEGSSENDTKIH